MNDIAYRFERRGDKIVRFATMRSLAIFVAALSSLWAFSGRAALSTDPVPLTAVKAESVPVIWRVKLDGRVALRLSNPEMTMEIGHHLPLFQQTDREFIAVIEGSDGTPALAAFPRMTSGGFTAWVSTERQVVFSQRTRSTTGRFTFDEGETVPLVRETPAAFLVEVERYGRKVTLSVPRETKGVDLMPVALAEPKPAAAVPTQVAVATVPAAAAVAVAPATAVTAPLPAPGTSPAATPETAEATQELSVQQIKNEILSGIMEEVERARQERAAKQAAEAKVAPPAAPLQPVVVPEPPPLVVTQVVKVVTQEVPVEKAAVAPPLKTGSWVEAMLTFYDHHTVGLLQVCVGLLVILMVAAKLGSRGKAPAKAPTPARSTAVNQASTLYAVSTVGESVSPGVTAHAPARATHAQTGTPAAPPRPRPTAAASTQHADLGGTLEGAILPQVVQYFTASRESGRLRVRREDGTEEYLFFDSGRIIDAQSGGVTGRDAAHRILLRRGGSFVFSRGDCSKHPRTIMEDSMAILLEAHQMMDESADNARH